MQRVRDRLRSVARVDHLREARDLCRGGHHLAAAHLCRRAIGAALSDLAIVARPAYRRFHNGKRLTAFLFGEKVIDQQMVRDLAQHNEQCYSIANQPVVSRVDVLRLIESSEALRTRLLAIQRSI